MSEVKRSPRLGVAHGHGQSQGHLAGLHKAIDYTKTANLTPEQLLADAFPAVDPGVRPFGERVLVQIRVARPYHIGPSGHKFHVPDETRDTEKWNTQVARVIALGPLAFHNRATQMPWPEGAWAQVGAFVRVPKYGGDRWEVPFGPAGDDKAMFVIFKDLDLIGAITGDPLAVRAFL